MCICIVHQLLRISLIWCVNVGYMHNLEQQCSPSKLSGGCLEMASTQTLKVWAFWKLSESTLQGVERLLGWLESNIWYMELGTRNHSVWRSDNYLQQPDRILLKWSNVQALANETEDLRSWLAPTIKVLQTPNVMLALQKRYWFDMKALQRQTGESVGLDSTRSQSVRCSECLIETCLILLKSLSTSNRWYLGQVISRNHSLVLRSCVCNVAELWTAVGLSYKPLKNKNQSNQKQTKMIWAAWCTCW